MPENPTGTDVRHAPGHTPGSTVVVISDAGERVSFPETGDPYEAARLKLARAIVAAARK